MNEPDPLTAYLATHDAPCPGCKYNLRGIQQPQCPECGRVLTLDGLLNPSRRLFYAIADVASFLMAFPFIVCATLIGLLMIDLGFSAAWFSAAVKFLICTGLAWAFLYPARRLLRKKMSWVFLFNPLTVLILLYLFMLLCVFIG